MMKCGRFDLGAVDIVAKPFEPHVVSRRVHNAVELSQNREHLERTVEGTVGQPAKNPQTYWWMHFLRN